MEDMTVAEGLLRRLLLHNKNAIHPGKGRVDCALITEICDIMEWDEDEFLDLIYLKDRRLNSDKRRFYPKDREPPS